MDDFITRALIAGLGIALVSGPLGCIMVWRRMVYFGAAVSHSALLGVALGIVMGISPTISILIFSLSFALLLFILQKVRWLANDTLLGILAHASLATGLILVAFMDTLRVDLMSYLFGDILAVDNTDLMVVGITAFLVLAILLKIWRPLLSLTVNRELAAVEGVNTEITDLIFTLLLASVIAIGLKLVGILLIVSLLVIPTAVARRISSTPEQMAVLSSIIGMISVSAGLYGSYQYDLPTGPAIVVVTTIAFFIALIVPKDLRRLE